MLKQSGEQENSEWQVANREIVVFKSLAVDLTIGPASSPSSSLKPSAR